jgi:hypothetical protein
MNSSSTKYFSLHFPTIFFILSFKLKGKKSNPEKIRNFYNEKQIKIKINLDYELLSP